MRDGEGTRDVAEIRLAGLGHSYVAGEDALQDIDLTWEDGGAYALLGPSGCGKTTMLDIISGLLRPSRGQVLFDGVDVTRQSPLERNIAQVFQFPVLYDSMTVEENMRFPLRNRGVPRDVAQRRAEEIAELLEISHLLKERARGLPADAKQLVSLSRALVRWEVSAVLFDEPLTVVDPQKKWTLRQALKRVHTELNHTLVYVTHDQTEALTFADVVVVMNEGQVMQRGTPDELFERPTHRFVGHFIGSPGMNFLPAVVREDVVGLAGVDLLRLPPEARGTPATDEVLGIRPDFVHCHPGPGARAIAARVTRVRDLGAAHLVHLTIGDGDDEVPLIAKVTGEGYVPTTECWVELEPDRIQLFRDGHFVTGCVPITDGTGSAGGGGES
jgi:glycerol transport system ATP-binding protein